MTPPADAGLLPVLPALAPRARLWIALSGGLDSTVLLHALAEQARPRLRAVHVHHGLQPAADRWVRHCRQLCRQLEVPLRVLKVQVPVPDPEGPEGAARRERYAALQALMKPGDCLSTAHQQEDQAETVLLRLLRGTGIAGLAAMRPLVGFGPGRLWRPLLSTPRAAIRAYAERHALRWIEDPHNADPRFARSYLRCEVLPRLAQRWPQGSEALARAAEHAAEAAELLATLGALDLAGLQQGAALSVRALLALPASRRRNALRVWLAQARLPAASGDTLAWIERDVLLARPDAAPLYVLGAHELRRYRDRLFLMPALAPLPAGARLRWNGLGRLALPPGCGALRLDGEPRPLKLAVRFLEGGEQLKPACGGPTRKLKNLFQEAGVPPWVRTRAPLIYEGESLRCVADYWCDRDWAARKRVLCWEVDLPGHTTRGER